MENQDRKADAGQRGGFLGKFTGGAARRYSQWGMTMENEDKREYIKALIQNLEGQKKFTMLMVTFPIAILALLLNKFLVVPSPSNYSASQSVILLCSFVSLALAAAMQFVWVTLLHLLAIKAVDSLATLDVDALRKVHYPGESFWKKWGWIQTSGSILLGLGVALTIAFVGVQIM